MWWGALGGHHDHFVSTNIDDAVFLADRQDRRRPDIYPRKHYAHLADKTLAAAVTKLPSFGGTDKRANLQSVAR